MAGVRKRRRLPEQRAAPVASSDRPEGIPLAVFALLTVAGPLAFGAVDRVMQIGLIALLAVGLALRPLQMAPLSRRAWGLMAVGLLGLLLKEFAPATLFGHTSWRTLLISSYGLSFPLTHHPEPGRAVDGLLTGAIALVWFGWVWTLAGWRPNRPVLAWSLFGAAAVVALVCFLTRGGDPHAIYGLRYTRGWRGFGPFPNRNHTASLLAMGALLGCGCLTWAAMHRRYRLLSFGGILLALIVAALLATESRGGLVALLAGGVIYILLVLAKLRTGRSAAIVGTLCLASLTLVLALGGPLLARFSDHTGSISNAGRRQVWHDTLRLWRDAPLLGHGVNSFASVFPIYQEIQTDDGAVAHPESSWLQALVELGLVPLALGAAGLGWFLVRSTREAFAQPRGFFLTAAGLAAVGALLVHATFDVPAHRWGTAGFALAALALAGPALRREKGSSSAEAPPPGRLVTLRSAALVPVAVAGYWLFPFFINGPGWAPLTNSRLIDRATFQVNVSAAEFERGLAWFPLSANLHQLYGMQEVREGAGVHGDWQRHFRVAARLQPGSWRLPITEAQVCAAIAPGFALSLWQMSIERSGFRGPELLTRAVNETAELPGAADTWASYAEAHPELALTYARLLPTQEGVPFFTLWWQQRGSQPATRFSEPEIAAFYARAADWAQPAQIEAWMKLRAPLQPADVHALAAIWHAWHDDARAWALLTPLRPEPPWPKTLPTLNRVALELRWRRSPENMLNAQELAHALHEAGESAAANEVIVKVAASPGALQWFLRKAAYLQAAEGKLDEAVETLLRDGTGKNEG